MRFTTDGRPTLADGVLLQVGAQVPSPTAVPNAGWHLPASKGFMKKDTSSPNRVSYLVDRYAAATCRLHVSLACVVAAALLPDVSSQCCDIRTVTPRASVMNNCENIKHASTGPAGWI